MKLQNTQYKNSLSTTTNLLGQFLYKEQPMNRLTKAKKLGLVLMKGQLLPQNLKSRENSNLLKEKLI
jgi:hypothetical protein